MRNHPTNSELVIGVGSPHGDDQVAWSVIDYLGTQPQLSDQLSLQKVADPIDLLELLDGIDRLVVIDACRSGRQLGALTRLDGSDNRVAMIQSHSTHGITLAETLRMARVLQRIPEQVVILGIDVGPCEPNADLCPSLHAEIPRIAQQIYEQLEIST